jgi:hypothetical protein
VIKACVALPLKDPISSQSAKKDETNTATVAVPCVFRQFFAAVNGP